VGGVPAILVSERYGLITAPQDLASLRDRLREALNRQWNHEDISQWGRSRSWQQVGGEVIDVMESIVSGKAHSEKLSYVRN
jgi:hypothetical protein